MTNQNRIDLAAIILFAGWTIAAFAQAPDAAPARGGTAFDLVTESEASQWSSAKPQGSDFKTRDLSEDNGTPSCRSTADNDADNPRIKIIAPVLEKPLLTPVEIELQFIPVGGAHLRPETFRVCYLGSVAMDISRRVTDRATISEYGLHLSQARLPHGHHRLLFLIADQRGRLARREAEFNVL